MPPLLTLALDDATLDALADRVVERLSWALPDTPGQCDGYMTPKSAARYLGVARKRVYDLKSAGALVPDGFDGRTPLFKQATLDRYATARES